MWPLKFIREEDFRKHVENTIEAYGEKLKPYDIKKFNSNIIDPIKMVFDKAVYAESWEQLITSEIFRQRDKAQTNDIGYFHQRIFQYMQNCHVPANGTEGGWDVIVNKPEGYEVAQGNIVHKIYVEMKNKHNTMNSSAAGKTYIKMQNQLLSNDDCVCFLVEAIAKKHQNIPWKTTVNGQKVSHVRIRRVSMDIFYETVTGESDAFYQICMVLPNVIDDVLKSSHKVVAPKDTVIDELKRTVSSYNIGDEDLAMMIAMYILGFSTYTGFDSLRTKEE